MGSARIEAAQDAGDIGVIQRIDNFAQRLRAFFRIGGGETLNDEHYAIHEGRPEARGKLLGYVFRFAALDAGRGLEVAFRMEGRRSQRKRGHCGQARDPEPDRR